MDDRKGKIQAGYDGDLVIWQPEVSYKVEESKVYFKNKLSPYVGKELYGLVDKTILRGTVVYDRQSPNPFASPVGGFLL